MEKKEFLNEEKYQKTKKTISKLSLIILIVGLLIGGTLIYFGIRKPSEDKLNELKIQLENKKAELIAEGVTQCGDYTCGKGYELYVINEALDPSFDNCPFSECKNNDITKAYCNEKNKINSPAKYAFIGFGIFAIIATLTFSGNILLISKGRDILSFMKQQTMPIAQESIEKMAPTIGKATATIAKEAAPAYGEIAKEITKGIKEATKEDEK